MAKDIESIDRSVSTPTSAISSGNAFDRLGDASGALANIITSKLNEAQIGMEATQGEKDALSGAAPKTLAPGFNRVTRAYNDAVSNTEAIHQISGAKEQINQAYAEATNPATFNSESPAIFKAKMQGIAEGTLEHTRDENRAKVGLQLEQMVGASSIDMLNHSIAFDNKESKTNFETDVNNLIRDRRNAAIEGHAGNLAAIDEQLAETFDNYGAMNAEINKSLPEIKRKVEESAQVDNVLSGFAHAASEGKQAEFLSDFSHNKDNLPFNVWDTASKEVLSLDATEQRLKNESRAISYQSVENGINNNSITTTDQFANQPDLTPLDYLKLTGQLEQHQQALVKNQYSLINAQKNISQGNPGLNSAEQKNTMFASARQQFEQQTGRPMNLVEMYQSISGQGPTPSSGIPGVPMGADVPQFNAVLTNQLTSKNPVQVIQAASIFNDAVNVKNKPNTIDLSGEALSIASNFNTLNLGNVDPLVLAEQVSKTTLDAKDPEMKVRGERFTKLYGGDSGPKQLRSVFKQVFNTDYMPGVSDNAYGVFKETYREQFLLSDSDAASINATKYSMRAWGTSKYFEDGMVGQPVPEKELAIANIGYVFDNQIAANIQNIINENKQAIQADPEHPFKIEWANPNKEVNLKASEEDRVFKRLGEEPMSFLLSPLSPESKPRVKINGQETELFLMPTAESRLGERVQFAMFYHDKFGMVQPVPDQSSPSGNAMFSPVGLDTWSPGIAKNQNDTRIKDAAIRFQHSKAMDEWDALQPTGVLANLLESAAPVTSRVVERLTSGTAEQRAEIFRKLKGGGADEISSFIRQRIQGDENAAVAPAEAAKADNVGIDAVQGAK